MFNVETIRHSTENGYARIQVFDYPSLEAANGLAEAFRLPNG